MRAQGIYEVKNPVRYSPSSFPIDYPPSQDFIVPKIWTSNPSADSWNA